MPDILTLIQQYGLAVALIVGGLVWLAKRVPAVAARLYTDRQALEKEEREERRERERSLVELVQNNTRVMTENTSAIRELSGTLHQMGGAITDLSTDVTVIYSHLQLSRPNRNEVAAVVFNKSAEFNKKEGEPYGSN